MIPGWPPITFNCFTWKNDKGEETGGYKTYKVNPDGTQTYVSDEELAAGFAEA